MRSSDGGSWLAVACTGKKNQPPAAGGVTQEKPGFEPRHQTNSPLTNEGILHTQPGVGKTGSRAAQVGGDHKEEWRTKWDPHTISQMQWNFHPRLCTCERAPPAVPAEPSRSPVVPLSCLWDGCAEVGSLTQHTLTSKWREASQTQPLSTDWISHENIIESHRREWNI